ncbi:RIP-like protein [Topomyia yanbarensis]|uniref:RIP-like protein n=1 Tax=Topomyia yanbarensis TaxID=2498891 RepID=UPI00273B0A2E|nr:RIP-like protein [Topomyia yanbarensis]
MELISSPPVYHTSAAQKCRSRNAAHRFKYGSPKLVDMMREKCRLRIKEARNDHLLRKRNIANEEKALLESIVRQELSEIEKDIELQELIFQELIAETNEWLFEEYERSENYMIDEYGQDVVFCPVCQKHELTQAESQLIRCLCGMQVRHANLECFGKVLRYTVDEHEPRCGASLQFFMEPVGEYGQLNAFCPSCDYYKNLTQ